MAEEALRVRAVAAAQVKRRANPNDAIFLAPVAVVETEEPLDILVIDPFWSGSTFENRLDAPSDDERAVLDDRARERREPARIGGSVVVEKGNVLAARMRHARVSRMGKSPLFFNVVCEGHRACRPEVLHDRSGGFRRLVVDDDDLETVARVLLCQHRGKRRSETFSAAVRADDDRERRGLDGSA